MDILYISSLDRFSTTLHQCLFLVFLLEKKDNITELLPCARSIFVIPQFFIVQRKTFLLFLFSTFGLSSKHSLSASESSAYLEFYLVFWFLGMRSIIIF